MIPLATIRLPAPWAQWLHSRPTAWVLGAAQAAAAAIGTSIVIASGFGLIAALWLFLIPAALLLLLWLSRPTDSSAHEIDSPYPPYVLTMCSADLQVEHRPPIR